MNPAEGSRKSPKEGQTSAPAAALPEADLFGKARSRLGIGGRHHRIVALQIPFLAILLGRKIMMSAQVPLDGFEFFSVLKTDDVVRSDGFPHRNSGFQLLLFRF